MSFPQPGTPTQANQALQDRQVQEACQGFKEPGGIPVLEERRACVVRVGGQERASGGLRALPERKALEVIFEVPESAPDPE